MGEQRRRTKPKYLEIRATEGKVEKFVNTKSSILALSVESAVNCNMTLLSPSDQKCDIILCSTGCKSSNFAYNLIYYFNILLYPVYIQIKRLNINNEMAV